VARSAKERVEEAARAVLIEGERVTSTGECWAVQVRSRVPLAFLARRKYLMALTDRRVLVFEPRRKGPQASDLVIGKRYETFTLEKVKRKRPLVQVSLLASSGNQLVFEFRRRQRELAGELVARLTPPPPSHAAGEPSTTETTLAAKLGATAPTDEDHKPEESVFWGQHS
jgi:hypothetical protein